MTTGVERARIMAQTLCLEVVDAISLQMMWARCADKTDIINPVKRAGIANGFDVARYAIHKTLVLTLIRLHDDGRKVASIPALLKLIESDNVRQHICPNAHGQFDELVEAAGRESKALRGSSEYLKLRKLRHERLAHRAADEGQIEAKFGYERIVLERTCSIVTNLNRAIVGSNADLDHVMDVHRSEAERFWTRIAKGLDQASVSGSMRSASE